jgi:hypothetical protein
VAEDESDTGDVINLQTNTVVESIPVIAPAPVLQSFALTQYTGANTNSVTLAEPGEDYLYVTNASTQRYDCDVVQIPNFLRAARLQPRQ